DICRQSRDCNDTSSNVDLPNDCLFVRLLPLECLLLQFQVDETAALTGWPFANHDNIAIIVIEYTRFTQNALQIRRLPGEFPLLFRPRLLLELLQLSLLTVFHREPAPYYSDTVG